MDQNQAAAECARLNDLCRLGELHQSRIVITRGCIDRFCNPEEPLSIFTVQSALSAKVRDHKFNADDDPYGERDFGAFEHDGEKLFWKIDYYDSDFKYGSEHPNDVEKTNRVLTIMLASDY